MSDPVKALIALFAETIAALISANGDAAKEEEALMRAQERIARERAVKKFGG